MSETAVDSYSQKLTECRLDPPGDPLIDGIREPYPFSSGFSTREVCAKALGWQQELAARVRDYQERPDIPLEGKTEAAGLLVKLAAEAAMAVETLSLEFPEAFKAVARKRGTFPVNLSALKEDNDKIISWLLERLQLGSGHELMLRAPRKTFSRSTFGNQLILHYLGRIKATAIERQRLRNENPFEWESVELTPEETLTELCAATARQWMALIWKLLLADCPAPEKHEQLKQFGAHKAKRTRIALGKSSPKSEAANHRAGIRDALLKYLLRMLPDK